MDMVRRVAGGMDPDELVNFAVWVERQGGHILKWLPLVKGLCYVVPAHRLILRNMGVGAWDEQDVRVYALGNNTNIPVATPAWNLTAIQAPDLWPRTQGEGVQVAVVDTGVDLDNPGLPHVAAGYNVLQSDAPPDDDNGHGTHVAGIVAGHWDSGSGVAPEAVVVPVKVLDEYGSGSLSDVVDGLHWCLQHRVPIINLSLGAPQAAETLHAAVAALAIAGLLVVAAAGNEGPGNNTVGYPAAWPETLAVAASTQTGRIAEFSSRGPQVDVTAPGQSIVSTWPGGGTKMLSGTSMATPHVSGGAALLWSLALQKQKYANPVELSPFITSTCCVLPGYPPDAQGKGLIQLAAAVSMAGLE